MGLLNKSDQEKTFILTDTCVWQMQMDDNTEYPHGIEVVDMETGQVRYLASGSQIKFVSGRITNGRNQKEYNESIKKQQDEESTEIEKGADIRTSES